MKKEYWITPPEIYAKLDQEFHFDYDPCPYPYNGVDGTETDWGRSTYLNPPFRKSDGQNGKRPTAFSGVWVGEKDMKIYKISQNLNNDYDTYDSAVVCAENEDEARKIHPSQFVTHYKDDTWYGTYSGGKGAGEEYETQNDSYSDWVKFTDIDKIRVEYIGEADESIKKGVIVASFNAG